MVIYLDNIIYSLQTSGGISVYWSELSKRWLKSEARVLFIERAADKNFFRQNFFIPRELILAESKAPLFFSRYMPVNLNSKDKCIFHSSYYRTTSNKKALSVVTVHDFTYEKMLTGVKMKIHQSHKKAALDKASGIICISENTKKDMLELYPYLSNKKITVIYNGVSDLFFPILNKQNCIENNIIAEFANRKYVLFVGGREGYKNFYFAVNVLRALKEYSLIIVGGGQINKNEKAFLTEALGNNWQHFISVSTETLNVLYNFAYFLCYPSSYEGFGIPVIEAERAGCPAIALNASSIPEIAANPQLLLKKLDVQEAIEKIDYLNCNRSEIIAKGIANSQQYSWNVCFEKVKNFYHEVMNS